jgi:hypothetical protein
MQNTVDEYENNIDDSSDEDEMDIDVEAANITLAGTIGLGTKRNYKSKINIMKKYFREKNKLEVFDEEGELKFPLDFHSLKSFLGHMGLAREDGSKQTASSIQGYVSAIKFYNNEAGAIIDTECQKLLKDFAKGHKRSVANLRQNGTMKRKEGKGLPNIDMF